MAEMVYQDEAVAIYHGDALAIIREIPDATVQTCITSPPYWGLRDYGVPGQIGLEPTPEEYVAKLVEVFREVRRVLRDDGTLWLNLGDSYASIGRSAVEASPKGTDGQARRPVAREVVWGKDRHDNFKWTLPGGIKPKDLVGIPWRVAFALQADGWYLRSDIIWAKPNPMPESVTDRPTKAHEYLFLLAKSERYYYDAEAIKEPDAYTDHTRSVLHRPEPSGGLMSPHAGIRLAEGRNGTGRNRRSVWTVATQPYPEAHFATFPPDLIKPCVLAGTSERGACAQCGAPWERVTSRTGVAPRFAPLAITEAGVLPNGPGTHRNMGGRYQAWLDENPTRTTGWRPTCRCRGQRGRTVPCVVLDPFAGAGTTLYVAKELGRRAIGVELNPEYIGLAERRLRQGVLAL